MTRFLFVNKKFTDVLKTIIDGKINNLLTHLALPSFLSVEADMTGEC